MSIRKLLLEWRECKRLVAVMMELDSRWADAENAVAELLNPYR